MTGLKLLDDISVTYTTLKIKWPKAEVQAAITGLLEKYKNIAVCADDIDGTKKDLAHLNKVIKMLGDARKKASDAISIPVKAFDTDMKDIEKQVSDVRVFIDNQFKVHIENERKERAVEVQMLIDEGISLSCLPDYHIPMQESWLNKGSKDKKIVSEIESIISTELAARNSAAMLERAKQDRISHIQELVQSSAQQFGFDLPIGLFSKYFDTNLNLVEAKPAILIAYQEEQERRTIAASKQQQIEQAVHAKKYSAEARQTASWPNPQTRSVEASAVAEVLAPFSRRASLVFIEGDPENPSFKAIMNVQFTGAGDKEGKANALFAHMKGMATVYGLELTTCLDGK